MPLELRPHQVDTLAFYIANKNCLNRSEPATGKTAPSCVMAKFVNENENGSTVFVMPKSLLVKNEEEITNWTGLKTLIYRGKPTLDKWKGETYDVILTTADTFANHFEQIRRMLAKAFGLLLADETHLYWSSAKAKRTQFILGICRKIPRNIWLTGTVIRGRLDSAFPVIQMIEPRYYGNHQTFMNQHSIQDSFTGEVIGWCNEAKINAILKIHSVNYLFRDVYGDPDYIYLPTHVDIDSKHYKAYKEFEEFANLELDDDSILYATEAGVQTIRCRQILGCPEVLGLKIADYGKDDWIFENLLNGDYQKVVLFSAMQGEQVRLVRKIEERGFKVGLINGTVDGNKRGQIDKAFREGDLQVIVASPATAGVGLNWHNCEVAAFVSIDYMDDNITQATFRFIRGKRDKTIPIYLLKYKNTIEDKIYGIVYQKSLLASKADSSRKPLQGLF
mgnify:CR=1 FL=1